MSTDIRFADSVATEIIWDERKRRANPAKRGLDFADLDAEFLLAAALRPAKPGRFTAIGRRRGSTVAVILSGKSRGTFSHIDAIRPCSREELLNAKEN